MLGELLTESRRYGALYGYGRLSNHLPMCLVAMKRLGASEERLREFAAMYAKRLEPKKSEEQADVARLEDELRRDGREATLLRRMPQLMRGVATAAFHGVIRLAYAIEADHDGEIAEAIAAWELEYSVVSAHRRRGGGGSAELFEAMRQDPRFPPGRVPGNSIVARIRTVTAMPAFGEYAMQPRDLRELADISLGIYAASRDFTALHMVTACHATRLVWPYVDDREDALAHLGTALLAAYITIGRPAPGDGARNPMAWDEIARRAVASDDDHVAKLVFAAREEQRQYGDPRYQEVAAWRVG